MAMYPCLSLPSLSFPSVSGAVCSFDSQYAGLPLKSHVVQLTAKQSGSGTPSPQNIRNIDGVSSFSTFNSDYNLIDANIYYGQYKSGNVYITTGTNFNSIRIPIGAFVGKQITFSAYLKPSSGITNVRVRAWIQNNNAYTNGNSLSGGNEGYSSITITPSSVFDFLNISFGSGGGNNVEVSNVQLEYGDTRTDYHAFVGQSFTIQFGSTIYGGNYDAVSGVLTVTHGCVKFGDCTFNYFANGSKSSAYRVNLPTPTTTCASNQRHGAISSMAGVEQTAYWGGVRVNEIDESCFAITTDGLKVCIYDTDTSITQADFLTKYSDCQIFYPLATPQTIQLPPCPIDTLQGVNNIFADTGDTTLQYIKLG